MTVIIKVSINDLIQLIFAKKVQKIGLYKENPNGN